MFGTPVLEQCIRAKVQAASVMDSQALLAEPLAKVSEYLQFLETVPPCTRSPNLRQQNSTMYRSPGSLLMTVGTEFCVNICMAPSARRLQLNLLAPTLSHYPSRSAYQP